MEELMNASKDLSRKTNALIIHFLKKIKERRTPEHDVFGTETLEHLIETLEVLNAPTRHWGKVATFILQQADRWMISSFYTSVLLTVVQHTSIKMSAKITAHFVRYGDVQHAMGVARARLTRNLTQEEVLIIAAFHRKQFTASTSNTWKMLLRLADRDGAARIKTMIDEVRYEEENPPLA